MKNKNMKDVEFKYNKTSFVILFLLLIGIGGFIHIRFLSDEQVRQLQVSLDDGIADISSISNTKLMSISSTGISSHRLKPECLMGATLLSYSSDKSFEEIIKQHKLDLLKQGWSQSKHHLILYNGNLQLYIRDFSDFVGDYQYQVIVTVFNDQECLKLPF